MRKRKDSEYARSVSATSDLRFEHKLGASSSQETELTPVSLHPRALLVETAVLPPRTLRNLIFLHQPG